MSVAARMQFTHEIVPISKVPECFKIEVDDVFFSFSRVSDKQARDVIVFLSPCSAPSRKMPNMCA